MDIEPRARLGVDDKRHLFLVLMAMTERLLMLNKFPVDQEDFALSLHPAEVEDAWRVISTVENMRTLSPSDTTYFRLKTNADAVTFQLHLYPDDEKSNHLHGYGRIFMAISGTSKSPTLGKARRHGSAVQTWAERQIRLEEQCLRAIKVIKAIVHSCNTVGQYKRVSPDLLTFLPDRYQLALKDYTKKSPYPAITVKPEEIETTLATLAYAALQPKHASEESYTAHGAYSAWRRYNLENFPRTYKYDKNELRQLQL